MPGDPGPPHRYPVGMTYSLNAGSNDPRLAALRERQQQEQKRLFITFAAIEGLLIAAALVVVYLLGVIDPEQGVWVLVAIAALGGFVFSTMLLSLVRRHTRERNELTGY